MFVLLCNLGQRFSDIHPKTHIFAAQEVRLRSPYTSSVSNYDRYLHSLLKEIGEEFNDNVITEVKVGGIVNRNENRKWELCTSHTGRRTFISYNVMRCPTEAEVRKCSGHKSVKTFERYITFDED